MGVAVSLTVAVAAAVAVAVALQAIRLGDVMTTFPVFQVLSIWLHSFHGSRFLHNIALHNIMIVTVILHRRIEYCTAPGVLDWFRRDRGHGFLPVLFGAQQRYW